MKTFLLGTGLAALLLGGCATTPGPRTALIRAPATCVDQTVQIYFDPDSAELTREGRLVIHQAAGAAAGCRVASVEVVGLADAQGAPEASLELSKRRAAAVAAVLAADGLPAAEFKVGAAGQAGALSPTGAAAPLRRRADVILHLAPRA